MLPGSLIDSRIGTRLPISRFDPSLCIRNFLHPTRCSRRKGSHEPPARSGVQAIPPTTSHTPTSVTAPSSGRQAAAAWRAHSHSKRQAKSLRHKQTRSKGPHGPCLLRSMQQRQRGIGADPRSSGGEANVDPISRIAYDRERGQQVPDAAPGCRGNRLRADTAALNITYTASVTAVETDTPSASHGSKCAMFVLLFYLVFFTILPDSLSSRSRRFCAPSADPSFRLRYSPSSDGRRR